MKPADKFRCRWALAALLLLPVPALPQTASSADWPALQRATPTPPGPGFTDRLRQAGFSAEQARPVVEALGTAARGGLPVDTLVLRVGEGLAKQASPEAIAQAVQARARSLEQADTALTTTGYKDCEAGPRQALLVAAALALESGLPGEDLCEVLQSGGGGSAGRVQSVIEAGETMHLAGLDRDTTRTLMCDCVERNLRRMEVLRATRFSLEQHRAGRGGPEIRRSLWGNNAPQQGERRGQGAGGGGFGRGSHGGGPPPHAGGASAVHGGMGPAGGGPASGNRP